MKTRPLNFFFPLSLLFLWVSLPFAAKPGIDQEAVQKAYADSEWDLVKGQLETYLRKKGDAQVSPEERIFAYKYLGVIYAADTLTKARAESYFHRLLDLSPDIDIVDMFASRRVNDLFLSIKAEHQRRLDYQKRHNQYGQVVASKGGNHADSMPALRRRQDPQPQPIPTRAQPKEKGSHAWVWWTAGTAVAAGAIAGIYVLTSQNEPGTAAPPDDIDATLNGNGSNP